jgi:hypothetical protein
MQPPDKPDDIELLQYFAGAHAVVNGSRKVRMQMRAMSSGPDDVAGYFSAPAIAIK